MLAVILVFYFTYSVINTYNEVLYVESDTNNKKYIIRRGKMKSNGFLKESANTLSEIDNRVKKLIDHLETKYKNDNGKYYFIKKLRENYHVDILSEAAMDSRYTTYTVDKRDMHICLRTRDSNERLYDINLLMYVILHELAHLCNYTRSGYPIQGHGQEFKDIFRLLVIEAIKLGIYQYKDYSQSPQEYCGIIINSTIIPSSNVNTYLTNF